MELLTSDRVHKLVAIAEQARKGLARFAGYEVAYDADAVQLLDEWIERHLQQTADPSSKMRLLWTCFLGEVFRRHLEGWWAMEKGGELVVLCPTESEKRHVVNVAEQIDNRIVQGMSASLALFYNVTRVDLKMG